MIAPNKTICNQARLYYYDYLCEESKDSIPSEMLDHIDGCNYCKAEVDTFEMQLISDQRNTDVSSESRDFAIIGTLKHHFSYASKSVTCKNVKPFIPSLSDPALAIKIPTPITVHVDKCQQCREDVETVRQADFQHKQLCRLAQLFAEENTVDEKDCAKTQQYIETIAKMTFGDTPAEVLRHVCVCPSCRKTLYNARENRRESVFQDSDISNIPCEAVSDTDIFDYVFPYGIDPDQDEYAMFRSSLTSHLTNCTKCLGKMQTLHNAIYGILEQQESGIVTCVNMDASFQEETDNDTDAYADWPIEVQAHDQIGEDEKNDTNITPSPKLKQPVSKIKLARFAKPIAAAAVIVLAISIFFNASVAEAIDLDQVYKALRKVVNVHITKYSENEMPISEKWISRTLDMVIFKTDTEWVLWDAGGKSIRSRSVSQQSVKTATIQKDALTKIKRAIMDIPSEVMPFDNTNEVSINAKWHKSSDLPDSTLDDSIAVYDLIWTHNDSHGVPVYSKLRCCIENDTKLPKKIEWWQKQADEEYKLTNIFEFDYPTENKIQLIIEEAGF